MKNIIIIVAVLAILIALFSLIPADESKKEVKNMLNPTSFEKISATSAKFTTDKGVFEIELYEKDAPKTVANFATLAKNGYYDGLTFHRVEIGIIQGGDPEGTGSGGESIYGNKFEDELNPSTASFKAGYAEGVIAMANAGPDTNGSQFFINQIDNNDKFSKAYTIFGKVTKGLDVVKKIQIGDVIKTIEVK